MTDQMQPGETPSGNQQPKSINTEGGAYVEGNVNSGRHFIGRDWVQNIFGSNEEVRNRRNHKVMRQLVRSFWIDGVLKSSLYNEVLIRLNMEERPKAVDNRPWDLILKQSGEPDYSIPAGTPIIDVFDRMNGLLLILGEPGSGKTTTLLELADELLKRTDADPAHPTPVVFNLSSWAEKRQPISKWLIDELRTKYSIPKKVAQQWIIGDELLLLLDGLDEVRQENREDCVKAINWFRQEHLVQVAICSRLADYDDLSTQLRLEGAVLVRPLTVVQIDEYLDLAGDELLAVRVALQQDVELQEMATTPLILSIMMLAYRGASITDASSTDSIHSRRQHLVDSYIGRILIHRTKHQLYSTHKIIRWLSWLAYNMKQQQQTLFLIEYLQPDWLQDRAKIQWFRLSVILGIILISVTVSEVVFQLVFTLGFALGITIIFGQLAFAVNWTMATLGGMLGTGTVIGIVPGLISIAILLLTSTLSIIKPVEQLRFSKATVSNMLLGMLIVILVDRFLPVPQKGLSFIIIIGLTVGFLVTLFKEINEPSHTYISTNTQYTNQAIWRSAQNMLKVMIGGVAIGVAGYFDGWQYLWMYIGERDRWLSEGIELETTLHFLGGITRGLNWGLIFMLIAGFISGGIACIQHIVLRIFLWKNKCAPLNYARFLDYCHDRLFLRKVGGGYIFIHRMLMEHFATMTDEDIERIAREVEAGR